jgi:prolipoprotein diacylglyceryltransferase
LFVYLTVRNRSHPPPGRLFREFIAAYFAFRFVIEFWRVEPVFWTGLTVFQVVALLVLIGMAAMRWEKRVCGRKET